MVSHHVAATKRAFTPEPPETPDDNSGAEDEPSASYEPEDDDIGKLNTVPLCLSRFHAVPTGMQMTRWNTALSKSERPWPAPAKQLRLDGRKGSYPEP